MSLLKPEGVVLLPLLAVIAGVSLTFLPPFFWPLEVNDNFSLYYLFTALLLLPLVYGYRQRLPKPRLFLAVLFALCVLLLKEVYPFLSPLPVREAAAVSSHEKGGHPLRVYYQNIFTRNRHMEAVRAQIVSSNADIVALVEVADAWHRALSFAALYPFQIVVPRDDNYGLALYSRFPIAAENRSFGADIPPAIEASISIPERGVLQLFLLHASPPLNDEALIRNRLLLRRIATRIRHSEHPVMVFGDFNATFHSAFYQQFVSGSRLKNAMEGFGLSYSWNALMPVLRLTLDHALYGEPITVKDFKVLPSLGSDHRAYLADFLVSQPSTPRL